jgi:hypothetical protein
MRNTNCSYLSVFLHLPDNKYAICCTFPGSEATLHLINRDLVSNPLLQHSLNNFHGMIQEFNRSMPSTFHWIALGFNHWDECATCQSRRICPSLSIIVHNSVNHYLFIYLKKLPRSTKNKASDTITSEPYLEHQCLKEKTTYCH